MIAPHALDEVLGCAGTMALAGDAGRAVHVLVLFGDGTGRDAQRRIAARQAGHILGTGRIDFAGFPENRGDTLPLSAVITAIEGVLAASSAETVYVAHGGNLHVDHQIAFRAAVTAARPAPGQKVRNLFAYEVPSSTDWAPPGMGMPFLPTRFVEISAALERKGRALEAYAAELPPPPHARAREAVLALASGRGAQVGLAAAEAFAVLREIEAGVPAHPMESC